MLTPTPLEWSTSLTPDTFGAGYEPEQWPSLHKAVIGAQSSLVSKALRMLNRPSQSASSDTPATPTLSLSHTLRAPELATLDTPPSSCIAAMSAATVAPMGTKTEEGDEMDALVKPPMVPSQTGHNVELGLFERRPASAGTESAWLASHSAPTPSCTWINVNITPEWFLGLEDTAESALNAPPPLCSTEHFVERDSFAAAYALSPRAQGHPSTSPSLHASYEPLSLLRPITDPSDPLALYSVLTDDSQSQNALVHMSRFGGGSQNTMPELYHPSSASETSVASDDWASLIDFGAASETPTAGASEALNTVPTPSVAPVLQHGRAFQLGSSAGAREGIEGLDSMPAPFKRQRMQTSTLDPLKVSLYHTDTHAPDSMGPVDIAPTTSVAARKPSTTPPRPLTKLETPDTLSPQLFDPASASASFARPRQPANDLPSPATAAPTSSTATRMGTVTLTCTHPGCGKHFSSSHNLNEHQQVHVSPRVRAYLCAVPGCAGRYYYKRDLQRHVRKKHAFAVRTAAAAAAKVEACSAGRAASKVPGRRLVR